MQKNQFWFSHLWKIFERKKITEFNLEKNNKNSRKCKTKLIVATLQGIVAFMVHPMKRIMLRGWGWWGYDYLGHVL
jgi:hypothetical protein